MQTIELQDYHILIGDFWNAFNSFLKERGYSKIVVIVDTNTSKLCLPILRQKSQYKDFEVIQIHEGEQHKTIETCQKIWQEMMKKGMERRSLTINLGGGVIGDMGGFCASTFKRGMDFIQMPTTLLSQVDASIGGKLGIDFHHIKNSIGVFKNPQAVFISSEFLNTLPKREIRSGFAEIIKHSLIADAENWEYLKTIKSLEKVEWANLLKPSLLIKQRIVEEDPFENGIRKALNFGHTIGHAIESIALQSDYPLLHGEAIAIGMICEGWLSHKILNFPLKKVEEIIQFFARFYDAFQLEEKDYSSYIELMKKDKKNENQTINFSLINPIGNAIINQTANQVLIRESLTFYNNSFGKYFNKK
ncbi:MAG: 3-dehydroquinate synthase [Saprospiraceae bacterium]|jgi:3-dehydroquinate synthase|nr:3-dehydroquinate synthase [Saprospiraceae bacterium]